MAAGAETTVATGVAGAFATLCETGAETGRFGVCDFAEECDDPCASLSVSLLGQNRIRRIRATRTMMVIVGQWLTTNPPAFDACAVCVWSFVPAGAAVGAREPVDGCTVG